MAFPKLQSEKERASMKLVQNGLYNRESLSLSGAYKGGGKKENPIVMPLDERFAFNTRDTF